MTRQHSVFNKSPIVGHEHNQDELIWTLLIPEEEIARVKIKGHLSSSCKYRAPVGSEQSRYVDYWQIYRTCVSSFQIYKFTVRCKSKCASLATLQLGLCNLWQRTHWWASLELPGHSVSPNRPHNCRSPPRSRLEKCTPTACVRFLARPVLSYFSHSSRSCPCSDKN